MQKLTTLVTLIMVSLLGCATIQTIDPAQYNFAAPNDSSYDQVWSAMIKVLNERGEFITLTDKQDGIIVTDYNHQNPVTSTSVSYSTRYRLNISIYNEDPVKIKIAPDIQLQSSTGSGWIAMKDDGTVLNQIKQNLAERLK